jgi:hypothetical protein
VIEVQHAGGWDNSYRNYTEPDRKYKHPKRQYEGLPDLSPLSKPKGLEEVKPKPDAKPLLDRSVEDANQKDLKSKNLK